MTDPDDKKKSDAPDRPTTAGVVDPRDGTTTGPKLPPAIKPPRNGDQEDDRKEADVG